MRILAVLLWLVDVRFIIGLVGFVLSCVFHELFHVVMHWGDDWSLSLFPDISTIAQVQFATPQVYDLPVEELFAYMITAVTMILTVKLIWEVHDSKSDKHIRKIIPFKNNEMAHMSSLELLEYMHKRKYI